MKISYKQIRRVTPVIVDLIMEDFLDPEQIAEIQSEWIKGVIKRGQVKRGVRVEV